MAAFRSIAQFYDVLSDSGGRLEREGPLLLDVLGRAPGAKVVDMACGTGLHARFLAEHGAAVEALDVSPEMIDYAREVRGHPGVEYRAGDMRELEGGPWDLAVCLGNSLSLLGSLEELSATLARVFDGLSPGGFFVAQILNYRAPSAQEPRHRVNRKRVDDTEIVAVKSLVPEGDRTYISLAFFSVEGEERSSVSETAVSLNVTDEQLLDAAAHAGLEVVEVYGGFDRSPFQADASGDLVCVLRRMG